MKKMIPKSGAFPLQKVLEFRKHLEDMQAIELVKVQNEKNKADDRLHRLKHHKQEALETTTREVLSSKTVDLTQLKIRKDYIENLNGKITHQVQKIVELEEQVEEKREKLGEAMKERKIVEKLKERFNERKKAEINRHENQKIDEVAIRMNSALGKKGV